MKLNDIDGVDAIIHGWQIELCCGSCFMFWFPHSSAPSAFSTRSYLCTTTCKPGRWTRMWMYYHVRINYHRQFMPRSVQFAMCHRPVIINAFCICIYIRIHTHTHIHEWLDQFEQIKNARERVRSPAHQRYHIHMHMISMHIWLSCAVNIVQWEKCHTEPNNNKWCALQAITTHTMVHFARNALLDIRMI